VKLSALSKCPIPQAPCLLCPAEYSFPLLSITIECQFPADIVLTLILSVTSLGKRIFSYEAMPNLLYLTFPQPYSWPLAVIAKLKLPPVATDTMFFPSSSLIF